MIVINKDLEKIVKVKEKKVLRVEKIDSFHINFEITVYLCDRDGKPEQLKQTAVIQIGGEDWERIKNAIDGKEENLTATPF